MQRTLENECLNKGEHMAHMQLKTVRERTHKPRFTQAGLDLIEDIKKVAPFPVAVLGTAGCGKTQVMHEVIKQSGKKAEYVGCHPGLDIIDVVGGWQSKADEQGRPIMTWADGPLTRASREGSFLLMDEITRLNQQHVGRIMGVTDETRILTLTENGGEKIEVHPEFQLLSTANPPSAGYNVVNLDEALKSRMMIYKFVTEPLCEEKLALEDILGGDQQYAQAFMNWADDMRKEPVTYISTRDLCYLAKLVGRGFEAVDAIRINLRDKVQADYQSVVMTSATAHFTS
tara:strand:+ start:816 stop:1676 length:861 start_codon:yes stop_codon:yes gene_type:complete